MRAAARPVEPVDRMISDEDVESALEFLRDRAADLGAAKARLVKAGHWIKHVEALEYKLSTATNIEGRKADARTSQRYIDAITEDAVATGEYERLKALREAAALTIQAWQTESSNYRSMRI